VFGIRLPHFATLLIAVAMLLMAALIAVVYFLKPQATLRVTTGPEGGVAQRFISAFVKVSAAEYPRVHLELVRVANLAESAKAIEDLKTNLALVRSDVAAPINGQTIAILRRDVVAFVLPPGSAIDNIAGLNGKTIGIPQGPLQDYNAAALDTILSYYDIPAKAVKRVFLPLAEIGQAVHQKHVAAILAVGPMAPGEVVDVVAAIAKATKGAPSLIGIDEAEAIANRFPAFESIDVPGGAFRGRPPTPDDTVTTLAVTYRFVAPNTMLNIVAGAVGRSIFKMKAKLVAETPLANQIEAPDPDDKSPLLPIHPGVAAYLSSGEQSFFDDFQEYFYLGGMILGVLGSATALVIGHLGRRKSDNELNQINRLIEITDRVSEADAAKLDALEKDFNEIVASILTRQASGDVDSNTFSIAVAHARHSIDRRRELLSEMSARAPAV
jgi:TRAP-type uncharacterized transport system substrate-binding protein